MGSIVLQHVHLLQPFDNSSTLVVEDSQLDNAAPATSSGTTTIRRSSTTEEVTCTSGSVLYQQSSFSGALALDASSSCVATVENSTFFTPAPGGPVLKLSDTSTMRFDTLVAGQATAVAPVLGYGPTATTIDSCVFAWNATSPSTSVTTYSLFNGAVAPTGTGNQAHDVSTFFADPANGDFHLKTGSPAVHGADPGDALAVDIEGTTRPSPIASTSDCGAYESAQ